MHKEAEPAAIAAIAAQNQGKFWQMHDALFNTPKLTAESIEQAAVTVGLDIEQFKKDIASPVTRQQLAKDMIDARNADVTGTPTLFINGRRIKSRSTADITKMVTEELAKGKISQ